MIPRGVVLIDYLGCFCGLCGVRLGMRLYREWVLSGRRLHADGLQRIVIVGAGDAGAAIAREFIGSPSRGFLPVAFFDDDTAKHGKLVHGVPVVGAIEALEEFKDSLLPAKAVIAMPSAASKRIREVVRIATQLGLKVETLPTMEELASGRVRASRIRPVEVTDLLGREAVNLDCEGLRQMIGDRIVMVTGAGGSIGGELCRQIAALNPKRLLMVEQSEAALFVIEQELNESGLGAIAVPLVADILDGGRMEFIFERYRPAIIFHAAAHKHVYLMERQPAEAIRNNVLGTRSLAAQAAEFGVDSFVFISTDKAINPTSVMGATKRLAELQLAAVAALASSTPRRSSWGSKARAVEAVTLAERSAVEDGLPNPAAFGNPGAFALGGESSSAGAGSDRECKTKFIAVRFGNVLGSSGSVIPIFKRQIANGGPVTVTHPEVTRYFMTIPEAVGLVLQAGVQGRGGEIFVLDMGQPVKIADLARQMIELSGFKVGDDIEISFTGLKPGEKLFEELQHHSEDHTPTEHPRIMRFTGRAMISESGLEDLTRQLHQLEPNVLKQKLKLLVPEYTPFLD